MNVGLPDISKKLFEKKHTLKRKSVNQKKNFY